MRRLAFSALAAAFIALPGILSAQDSAQVPVSRRQEVRIMAPLHGVIRPTIATVMDVRGDTLVVRTVGYRAASEEQMIILREVPLGDVVRLEVPMGPESRVRGMFVGSVVGTGLGLVGALLDRRHTLSTRQCPFDEFTCRNEWSPYQVEKGVAITLGGTLVGAAAGYLIPGRRWRDVLPVAPQAAVNADGSVLVAGTVEF